MNNKFGFILNRLVLSNSTETREIKFYKGLNFISGPTDTGKTYIYQLIKYLLGSNDVPKKIPENKNFNTAFLEIQSHSRNEIITLNRILDTNKINIYSTSFENIEVNTPSNSFNTRGSSKIISKELMEYAGLYTDKNIKRTIREEKYQNINFRNFLHFSLVDEIQVINDKSLLFEGQYVSKTFDLNFFYYLISGTSNNYLTYLSDKKESNKKTVPQVLRVDEDRKSKNNPIKEIIYKTKDEVVYLEEEYNKINEITYNEEFEFITTEISSKTKKIHDLFKDMEKTKSKILMNNELIKRFNLLREQFNSDMERLEFILEGGGIISNLSIENCTVCGSKLSDLKHNHNNSSDSIDIDGESLYSSYKSEKNKIQLNLKDLNETIELIHNQNKDLKNTLNENESSFNILNSHINNELKPTKKSLEEKMGKAVEKEVIKQKIIYLTTMINELNTETKGIPLDLKIVSNINNDNDNVSSSINELCQIMSKHLEDMRFNQVNSAIEVYFDYKEHDFIIDNKLRSVYGKGYRAIIYAVFLISLMQYCYTKNLPHTGFVLIDSPLTTYQEGEELDEKDKIPNDLKKRFIQTFSKERENQIIILDNQFDMDTNGINYIKFTKKADEGRYGFL
ncbi:hypothetical protein [Lysinibacillus capsici]|uniref:hypothetical protein n=1 Tax=Lysinibacillus capsici TaxID=2115968 RepID=UPI0034E4D654